jgi:hypothetical protein
MGNAQFAGRSNYGNNNSVMSWNVDAIDEVMITIFCCPNVWTNNTVLLLCCNWLSCSRVSIV